MRKFVPKTSNRHTWKARRQGTTNNSHIVRCTHTSESADVEAQNVIMGTNITCSTIVTTEQI
jgi:hypothetical protein